MTDLPDPSTPNPILRKVESIALFKLSEAERAALVALPMQEAQFDARQDIVREGIARPGVLRCWTASSPRIRPPSRASARSRRSTSR
ncbi:hypothetical protein [Methylobacterium sp. WL1]|uniref:hypothetical protein n=1 Tax=Methylobacterium sp. WL1 TaxID=2603276 RepID=UPI0032B194D5